jgi:hypothetical protein
MVAGRSWSNIFMILWFFVYGILAITNITFVFAPVVLGILALLIVVALVFGK